MRVLPLDHPQLKVPLSLHDELCGLSTQMNAHVLIVRQAVRPQSVTLLRTLLHIEKRLWTGLRYEQLEFAVSMLLKSPNSPRFYRLRVPTYRRQA